MAKTVKWDQEEIDIVVATYLNMLDKELNGIPFNKSEIRKDTLENHLIRRNKKAFEFRCANISSVLNSLGLPYINGYQPRDHVGPGPSKMILLALSKVGHIKTEESELDAKSSPYENAGNGSVTLSKEDISDYSLPRGNESPEQKPKTGTSPQRNEAVKQWVLKNANGICEGCNQPGPFKKKDGQLYLEVHHVTFLSQGGPDTINNAVALCPACHARCHFANDLDSFAEELKTSVLIHRPEHPQD